MEKTKIKLWDTPLEDVFKILLSRLHSRNKMSQRRVEEHNHYQDGITRKVTYSYNLMNPYWNNGKLIVQENYCILLRPGKTDLTAEDVDTNIMIDGLIFTFFQVQKNVLLELEYLAHWQELVDSILYELSELFPQPPIPFGPGYWELVENRTRNTPIFGGKTTISDIDKETKQDEKMFENEQTIDENFVYAGLYTGRAGYFRVPLALMVTSIEGTVYPYLELTKTLSSNDAVRYTLRGNDEKFEVAFSRNGDETRIEVTPDMNNKIGQHFYVPMSETRKIAATFLAEVLNRAMRLSKQIPPAPAESGQNKGTIPGLTSQTTLADIVKKLAKDTTSVVNPTLSDLENDAARFRILRNGGDVSEQPEKGKEIKLPSRKKDRNKWIDVWELIRAKVTNDKTLTPEDMQEFLENHSSGLAHNLKRDTIKKIMILGNAGGIPDRS